MQNTVRMSTQQGRFLNNRSGSEKFWPICAGVSILGLYLLLGVNNVVNKPRTHSGGDFMVPTFAGSGSYRDGTRSIRFDSPSKSLGDNINNLFMMSFTSKMVLILIGVGILFKFCTDVKKSKYCFECKRYACDQH